mgnify:CR=1 FL=1
MTYYNDTIRALLLQLSPSSPLRWASASLTRLFDRLCQWQAQARERHSLQSMTDQQLKDVGLSRSDALFGRGRQYY